MRSRPHPLQLTVIDLVGDIVCGADFAREAGAMKSTVMAEHIDILLDSSRLPSPSPSALWRQKLFARLFPRIIKKIEESSQSDSPLASNIAPLIVFCKFLGALDPSITFSAPKSAVDVLVRVMDIITVDRSASPQLQYWALTATLVACGSQPEVVQLIAAHLNTLVRCLEAVSAGRLPGFCVSLSVLSRCQSAQPRRDRGV